MFIGKIKFHMMMKVVVEIKIHFNITSSVGDNVTPTDTTPNTGDYSISKNLKLSKIVVH